MSRIQSSISDLSDAERSLSSELQNRQTDIDRLRLILEQVCCLEIVCCCYLQQYGAYNACDNVDLYDHILW